MKAVRCRRFGPASDLVIEDIEPPQPGPGEVMVKIEAAGINFPDSLIIQDKYQLKPPLPFSPGGEFAGVVTRCGEAVRHLQPGQPVIGFTGWGAFAEQIVVREDRLFAMPEGLPFDIGGSFLMTYGTAHHALKDRAQLARGETALVLGAASTPEKLATCREHGADETIAYEGENLRERKENRDGRHLRGEPSRPRRSTNRIAPAGPRCAKPFSIRR